MWTVAYTYNGQTYSSNWDSLLLAQLEMMRLEAFGMKPTIHSKEWKRII